MELRIVKAFRNHDVPLQVIRAAIEGAKAMFGIEYPFTAHRFLTDGKSIFSEALQEHGDAEMTDLAKRQLVFEHVFRPALYAGIEFAGDGQATRWFPVQRSKAIVLDPQIAFGKPVLTDYGVRTEIVAEAFKAEKNKKTIASLFDIPVAAVESALRYERMAACSISSTTIFPRIWPTPSRNCAGSKRQLRASYILRDRFAPNAKDHDWIKELGEEGRWVVLSQDAFRKNDIERKALRDSGLITFVLHRQWTERQHRDKARNLVKWWPAIPDQSRRIKGGAAFRVPWRYSGGKFEQISL